MILTLSTAAYDAIVATYAAQGQLWVTWYAGPLIHDVRALVLPRSEESDIALVLVDAPFLNVGVYTLDSLQNSATVYIGGGAVTIGGGRWLVTAPQNT